MRLHAVTGRTLTRLWDDLTRPSSAISDSAGRSEARLLASLLVLLLPLGILATLTSRTASIEAGRPAAERLLMFAEAALWLTAYGLSRSRHYRPGTLLSAGIAVLLIPFLALHQGDWGRLTFLLLPVLFSSLVFSMRATYITAVMCLLQLLALPLIWPARVLWTDVSDPGALVVMGSVLSLLLVRHRNQSEAYRRAQLAEQEARYRAVVDDQTELVARYLPEDGTLTFVNDAVCLFLGASREILLGRCVDLSLVEAEKAAAIRAVTALRAACPHSEFEVAVRRGDGDSRWLHCANRAILDAAGSVVEIQTVARDVTDRVRAESALAESERRFRGIFEQAPVGLYRTTPDGRILIANQALIAMLGYESFAALASRDLARHGFGMTTPREGFVAELEAAGAVNSTESVWLTKDGRPIWVRETARLVSDDEGRPAYYEGVAVDRTAERAAQEDLAAQASFLRTLHAITRAALEATDLDDLLQVVADRLREAFHADSCYVTLWDEKDGRTVPMAASGEWRDRYRDNSSSQDGPTLTASVLAANRALAIEDNRNSPYLSPDIAELYPDRSLLGLPFIAGEQRLGAALLGYVQRRSFEDDEIARGEQIASHIALAVRNGLLHEEVRSYAGELEARVASRTAELARERAHLRAILDSTAEGIVVTDARGEITRANRVAEAWLSRTLLPAESQQLRESMRVLVRGPDPDAACVLSLAGLDLQLSAAPVVGTTQLDAVVVSIHDITHIRAMDRIKTEFIHNVSHELRTPVATLKLYAHLLPTAQAERRRAYEDAVAVEVDRLSRLTEDIITMSGLDTGRLTLECQEVDLVDTLARCCVGVAPFAERGGLAIEQQIDRSSPPAWADPTRVEEALMQLLRNAIAYTPSGG